MKALVASAPAKVMLFGEWAVLDGAPCVLSALSPRFTAKLEAAPGPGLVLDAGADGRHEAGQPVPAFFALARTLLEALRPLAQEGCELFQPGRRLFLKRSWPLTEGIGSSSALTACLLGLALRPENGQVPAPASVWILGRELIRLGQGGRGSGADLAAQLWGGRVLVEGSRPRSLALDMPKELLLAHTGQKTSTTRALAETARDPAALKEIAAATQAFLGDRDWLAALTRHFEALSALGVVPPEVSRLRSEWKQSGLIGELKTTGAGGGDALLIWSAPERRAELAAALKKCGYYVSPHSWGGAGMDVA